MSETHKIIPSAFRRHIGTVEAAVDGVLRDVEKSAELLLEVASRGRKLLVCGNGGSAADTQHLVGEWLCKYKDTRRPIPAIALTVDSSTVTAIGNDYGFEHVFSRQVEALGNDGDVLVAISTSGASPNILRAIETARSKNMKVIVLTGLHGAALKDRADVAVAVPSEETARIQEVHGIIIHAWCEYVDAGL